MEHTQTLQVDTRKLLSNSRQYGLFLANVAGITLAPTASWKEIEQALPARFDLTTLMQASDPIIYLELIDALAGDAHVKQAGRLLLAMTRRFYLPLLPSDHAGYAPALALLDVLSAWIEGKGRAEDYVAAAFRFRCQYGTTYSAMGKHPEYDFLFEAMPSGGLDCALGEGCWNLASSWRSFCRHAASTDRDWELLDTLVDDLDAAGFAADVKEAVLSEVFDPMRETLTDGASDSYIDTLAKLVVEYFPLAQVDGEGAAVAQESIEPGLSPHPTHEEMVMWLYGRDDSAPSDQPDAVNPPFPPEMIAAMRQKRAASRLDRLRGSGCSESGDGSESNPSAIAPTDPAKRPPDAGGQAPLPDAGI